MLDSGSTLLRNRQLIRRNRALLSVQTNPSVRIESYAATQSKLRLLQNNKTKVSDKQRCVNFSIDPVQNGGVAVHPPLRNAKASERVQKSNASAVKHYGARQEAAILAQRSRSSKISSKLPVSLKSKEVVAQLPSFTTSLSPALPARHAPNLVKGLYVADQGVNVGIRRSTDLLK